MKVFVTGGTGFVGRAVVKAMLKRNYEVALLARNSKSLDSMGALSDAVSSVYGTIYDAEVLRKAMRGCDAVVHLVGIIREIRENTFERAHYEGAVNVMESARASGIQRFIHMSAEGTRAAAQSRYHQTKFKAEEYLKASGLHYTIMRPAVMFGAGDKNFTVLADMIKKAPLVPVIGDGTYVWQPVAVKDVAELFVLSLGNNGSEGKTYEVRGTEAFTFNHILDLLMKLLGVHKPKVHIPAGFVRPVIAAFDGLMPLPITKDQLIMLLDRYEQPESNFQEDFHIRLATLEEGLREYIGTNRTITESG